MSNVHAIAIDLSAATVNTPRPRPRPELVGKTPANEPTVPAGDRAMPAYDREPFETDGPATCLVWF